MIDDCRRAGVIDTEVAADVSERGGYENTTWWWAESGTTYSINKPCRSAPGHSLGRASTNTRDVHCHYLRSGTSGDGKMS